MWANKKPDAPQAANPEPKTLQTNQPPKPAPAFWVATTKMNKDAMHPTRATADGATAWLGSSLRGLFSSPKWAGVDVKSGEPI